MKHVGVSLVAAAASGSRWNECTMCAQRPDAMRRPTEREKHWGRDRER